jgi:hypothetical protein
MAPGPSAHIDVVIQDVLGHSSPPTTATIYVARPKGLDL